MSNKFVDGITFLGVEQCGCLWVFMNITGQSVDISKREFALVLKSWVFVVFS